MISDSPIIAVILVHSEGLNHRRANGGRFENASLHNAHTEFGSVVVSVEYVDYDASVISFGRRSIVLYHHRQYMLRYAFPAGQ